MCCPFNISYLLKALTMINFLESKNSKIATRITRVSTEQYKQNA